MNSRNLSIPELIVCRIKNLKMPKFLDTIKEVFFVKCVIVDLISSNPSFKEGHAGLKKFPLKPLFDH